LHLLAVGTAIAAQFAPSGEPFSRTTIYSFGFLFFWAVSAVAATIAAWMLAPHRS
jgi:predicted metal-binding membrane protein